MQVLIVFKIISYSFEFLIRRLKTLIFCSQLFIFLPWATNHIQQLEDIRDTFVPPVHAYVDWAAAWHTCAMDKFTATCYRRSGYDNGETKSATGHLYIATFKLGLDFDHRMMPWKFCDIIFNGSQVIMLTDKQTNKVRHKRTLLKAISPSLCYAAQVVKSNIIFPLTAMVTLTL